MPNFETVRLRCQFPPMTRGEISPDDLDQLAAVALEHGRNSPEANELRAKLGISVEKKQAITCPRQLKKPMEAVLNYPGATTEEVRALCGFYIDTTRRQLRQLERYGFVYRKKGSKAVDSHRWFPVMLQRDENAPRVEEGP
ncbi:MAG: hypothetical protein B7733_08530 [Myxococcales bacterium FL481]|nr:MAG: hypothetical protein B7733_08530 [Myxococcales bacterium FL481]